MQTTFSPSSLNCFDNCPKQYHFRYVEKVEVETEGIEAFVGKRVHEVLERLYQFVAEGLVPTRDQVLYRYRQNFGEQFDAERIRIVREGTDVAFYHDAGLRGLDNYYQRNYPFDDGTTLGIERRVRLLLDEPGDYAIRGIVDRIVRARDGALEIHDYKTGRRVPRQEALDQDRQLGLYELALREQYDERGEVRLVWHYVVPNQVRVSRRTPEQREELRSRTMATIDRIRGEREWRPRPSPLCGWCEFRALCPVWAEEPAAEESPAATAQPDARPPDPAPVETPSPACDRHGQLQLW